MKTRMSIEHEFPTVEAMEQPAAMGVDEGKTQALGRSTRSRLRTGGPVEAIRFQLDDRIETRKELP
jgi:hypothetical protein